MNSRHGKDAAAADGTLRNKTRHRERSGSFADFLQASSLRGSKLRIERLKETSAPPNVS